MNNFLDVVLVVPADVACSDEVFAVVMVKTGDPRAARLMAEARMKGRLAMDGYPVESVRALMSGTPGNFDHLIGEVFDPCVVDGGE